MAQAALPDYAASIRRTRRSPLAAALVASRNPAGSLGRTPGSGRGTTSLAGALGASGAGAGGQNPGLASALGAVSATPSSAPDFQALLAKVQAIRAARSGTVPGDPASTSTAPSAGGVDPASGISFEVHGPLDSRAKGAIALARHYIGVTPYVWGGTSPSGFDCSGLVSYVYGHEGISTGRTTYEQWRRGKAVAVSALRPGDVVFFHMGPNGPEHEGLYIGGGRMIEAAHSGTRVRIASISGRGLVGARRFTRSRR